MNTTSAIDDRGIRAIIRSLPTDNRYLDVSLRTRTRVDWRQSEANREKMVGEDGFRLISDNVRGGPKPCSVFVTAEKYPSCA